MIPRFRLPRPLSPASALAAWALLAAMPGPAWAQMRLYTGGAKAAEARNNLPGDFRAASGEIALPRYLETSGDHELSMSQSILLSVSPQSVAGPFLPRASLTIKALPFMDVHAAMGPIIRFALRGPIYTTASLGLGWSLGYRSDVVPTGRFTAAGDFQPGTAPPGTSPQAGFWLHPGVAVARGGEIRLEGLNRIALDAGFLDLGLSPFGYSQGNRSGGGADLTVDWALDRFSLGYTGTAAYNALNPFDPAIAITPLELQHAVGTRILMGDRNYLQLGYRFVQADTYGNSWHMLNVGMGFRSAPVPPPETEEEGEAKPAGKMKTSE